MSLNTQGQVLCLTMREVREKGEVLSAALERGNQHRRASCHIWHGIFRSRRLMRMLFFNFWK